MNKKLPTSYTTASSSFLSGLGKSRGLSPSYPPLPSPKERGDFILKFFSARRQQQIDGRRPTGRQTDRQTGLAKT